MWREHCDNEYYHICKLLFKTSRLTVVMYIAFVRHVYMF